MKLLLILLALLFPVIAQAATPLTLTWQDNSSNEAGFILERKLNTGGYVVIASGIGANIITYTDSTVVQSSLVDNVYCYRLKAFVGTTQSAYSNEACATILKLITVNAPSNLVVTPLVQSKLDLEWQEHCPECVSQEIVLTQLNPFKYYIFTVAATTENFIVEVVPKNKNVSAKVHGKLPDGSYTAYSNTATGRTK